MSEELVKSVQEMLKEEHWTRATISNYTKNKLIDLSEIVKKARDENCADEIKKICDEHLSHTKESIIALYLSSMAGLQQRTLDNSNLENLVAIFKKNHKDDLTEYLCETVLEDEENKNNESARKFALRTLGEFYHAANDPREWAIFEKMVKTDSEEAEYAKLLAEHYESEGNTNSAVSLYKTAISRFVKPNNISVKAIKEIWAKLISLIPDETDFFFSTQKEIEKSVSAETSSLLLRDLYPYYKENQKWDTAIKLLKIILTIEPKDSWARKEIVDCYKGKYSTHEKLEEYIRSSNLEQSFRNVFEAINDFEKHIAFAAKNFVYHRTWGVGIIRSVENDMLTINFGSKNGIKVMTLKMAVSALLPLAKDHIWVLKAKAVKAESKAKLHEKVKNEISWALKTVIDSFGGSCDFKKIKAELVPDILSASEWTNWNNKAKKILETDSTFGVNPSNINEYIVREKEISQEEKLGNEFKAQKLFFPRIEILMRFLNDDKTDKESEIFEEMFSYFEKFLKSLGQVNEQVVASFLVAQKVGEKLSKDLPKFDFQPAFTFEQMYREIENPCEMYLTLKDIKIKEQDDLSFQQCFLKNIKLLPDWVDQYIKLFPTALSKKMTDDLVQQDQIERLQKLVIEIFENFKEYKNAVLFLFEHCKDEDWFKETGISTQKQLIAIINIISQTYKEIENHIATTENRRINKNAQKLLFNEKTKDLGKFFADFILSSDIETVSHIYTLINDISELDSEKKYQMRQKIHSKYPDYVFPKNEEKTANQKGMFVTKNKLDEKQKLAEQMQTDEIPKIAKEVADAKEKGDLKENAEYIAAKEAQQKLNNDLKRLEGEIARAVVFDPTTATTSQISFGTKVVLLNNDLNRDEEYTILGPWESDPVSGIISYMSPFGNALLNHKAEENLSFTINEHKYNYTVKSIELAKDL